MLKNRREVDQGADEKAVSDCLENFKDDIEVETLQKLCGQYASLGGVACEQVLDALKKYLCSDTFADLLPKKISALVFNDGDTLGLFSHLATWMSPNNKARELLALALYLVYLKSFDVGAMPDSEAEEEDVENGLLCDEYYKHIGYFAGATFKTITDVAIYGQYMCRKLGIPLLLWVHSQIAFIDAKEFADVETPLVSMVKKAMGKNEDEKEWRDELHNRAIYLAYVCDEACKIALSTLENYDISLKRSVLYKGNIDSLLQLAVVVLALKKESLKNKYITQEVLDEAYRSFAVYQAHCEHEDVEGLNNFLQDVMKSGTPQMTEREKYSDNTLVLRSLVLAGAMDAKQALTIVARKVRKGLDSSKAVKKYIEKNYNTDKYLVMYYELVNEAKLDTLYLEDMMDSTAKTYPKLNLTFGVGCVALLYFLTKHRGYTIADLNDRPLLIASCCGIIVCAAYFMSNGICSIVYPPQERSYIGLLEVEYNNAYNLTLTEQASIE